MELEMNVVYELWYGRYPHINDFIYEKNGKLNEFGSFLVKEHTDYFDRLGFIAAGTVGRLTKSSK
jgi:hypothetical protein